MVGDTVWVWIWSHRYGADAAVFSSEVAAQRAMASEILTVLEDEAEDSDEAKSELEDMQALYDDGKFQEILDHRMDSTDETIEIRRCQIREWR